MSNFLSNETRSRLLILHRNEKNGKVRDRIKAILLSDEGWTHEEIAHALFLSDEGVRKQINDYKKANKIAPENGGSSSKLNEQQTEELREHLEANTYIKVKDIVSYVKNAFDTSYSISGMTDWLKANGFTYHKPAVVPAKADSKQQKVWIDDYEQLKKHLPEEDTILFYDGVHPSHEVRAVRGWIKKGQRKELPTNSGQRRVNILGALNLETMELFSKQYKTIDAEATKDFFNYLQEQIPKGKIHVISDCARYNKCREVQSYVSENRRIVLRYLPPYSPNLNAIEPCWKLMREHVTDNKYYATFKEFTEAVTCFFKNTFPKYSSSWVDRLTDNFRTIQSPLTTNS